MSYIWSTDFLFIIAIATVIFIHSTLNRINQNIIRIIIKIDQVSSDLYDKEATWEFRQTVCDDLQHIRDLIGDIDERARITRMYQDDSLELMRDAAKTLKLISGHVEVIGYNSRSE